MMEKVSQLSIPLDAHSGRDTTVQAVFCSPMAPKTIWEMIHSSSPGSSR